MLACALLDEGEGVSGFSSKVNYKDPRHGIGRAGEAGAEVTKKRVPESVSSLAFSRIGRRDRRLLCYAIRAVLMALALGHDGRANAATQVIGQFVKVGVPINLDGHLGCVANDVAVMAPLKVVFQLRPCLGVHRVVQVIG